MYVSDPKMVTDILCCCTGPSFPRIDIDVFEQSVLDIRDLHA